MYIVGREQDMMPREWDYTSGIPMHLIVDDWMIIALKYVMNSESCIYKFQHMKNTV